MALRWQIGIALAGSLVVLFLLRSLALSTTATAPPFYRRAYVEGVAGVPRQLNPLLQTPHRPGPEADLTALLFEGLTRLGPDGTPEPGLATGWSVDPGGTVYTFTLRSGLRWHDATPLTAHDAVFTIRSVQDPEFAGDPALAEPWRDVRVEEVGDAQIRFTLRRPFAPFLAATSLPILPSHLLEDVPPAGWATAPFSSRPIGSGPFRLYALDGHEAMLTPFEGAVQGRPKVDLLVLRFFPSIEAAREALERNEIQGVAFEALPGVAPVPMRDSFQEIYAPLAAYAILTLNLREPPLDDARLRAALARGLDREDLIQRVLAGRGQRLDTPILPQAPLHGDAGLPAPYRQIAEQALDDLGWQRGAGGLREGDGRTLRLPLVCSSDPGQLALAREIARQWRAIGVDVPIETLAPEDLQDRLQERTFTLALHSWNLTGAGSDAFALWHSSQVASGANYAGLADDRIDELLIQALATTDPEERTQIFHEFEERWVALLPGLPLYQPILVYELAPGVRPVGLDSTWLLPTWASRFNSISEWTVQTGPGDSSPG